MSDLSRESDVERFDRWSRTYEKSFLQNFLFDRVHRDVLTLVAHQTEPHCLLDVGCGTGRLLRAAKVRWPHANLIGVDPAPGMVDVARRRTSGAAFYVGFAENLPLPDALADVALSTISFHHWKDHAAGVREVTRVLRPDGYFFLTDVYAPDWITRFIRHPAAPQPDRICAIFADAGLTVLMQRRVVSRHYLVTVGRLH